MLSLKLMEHAAVARVWASMMLTRHDGRGNRAATRAAE